MVAGGSVTLLYTMMAILLRSFWLKGDAVWAGGLAFLLTQPIAFVVHRRVTFPDASGDRDNRLRFLVVAICGFLITLGIMRLVTIAGLPFWIGLAAGWVVIPIANYVIGCLWVFRTRSLLHVDMPK